MADDDDLPTNDHPATQFFLGVVELEGGFEPATETLRRALQKAEPQDPGLDDDPEPEPAASKARRLRDAAVLAQTAAVTLAYEAGVWAAIGKAQDAGLPQLAYEEANRE